MAIGQNSPERNAQPISSSSHIKTKIAAVIPAIITYPNNTSINVNIFFVSPYIYN